MCWQLQEHHADTTVRTPPHLRGGQTQTSKHPTGCPWRRVRTARGRGCWAQANQQASAWTPPGEAHWPAAAMSSYHPLRASSLNTLRNTAGAVGRAGCIHSSGALISVRHTPVAAAVAEETHNCDWATLPALTKRSPLGTTSVLSSWVAAGSGSRIGTRSWQAAQLLWSQVQGVQWLEGVRVPKCRVDSWAWVWGKQRRLSIKPCQVDFQSGRLNENARRPQAQQRRGARVITQLHAAAALNTAAPCSRCHPCTHPPQQPSTCLAGRLLLRMLRG